MSTVAVAVDDIIVGEASALPALLRTPLPRPTAKHAPRPSRPRQKTRRLSDAGGASVHDNTRNIVVSSS